MQFGNYNETPEFVNILLLGKNLFNVIAVNPSIAQLQKMKDSGLNVFVPEKEPEYIGKTSAKFGGPEDTPYFDARFYLKSVQDPTLIYQVSYRVLNTQEVDKAGVKWRIINPYGQTAWIPQVEIDAKAAASAPAFFISNDGFRKAYKGEENLIKFLRALLNFPVVANATPDANGKMRKAIDIDKRKNYVAAFDVTGINEMLAGNFSKLQSVIANVSALGTVGFLSGVRTTTNDEGKERQYQAFYADEPLRKYSVEKDGGDNYLLKTLNEAIDNGRFSNIYWGSHSLVGRVFDPKEMPSAAPQAAGNPFGDTSGFSAPATNNPFPPAPDFSGTEAEDDLPF